MTGELIIIILVALLLLWYSSHITSAPLPIYTPSLPINTPHAPILPINAPILPINAPILPINAPILPINAPILPINAPILPITAFKKWNTISGKDLSGPALYALGRGSTVDQCKKGCMDTPGCVGFSTYPTSGECWGKASTTLINNPDTSTWLYQ